MKAPAFHRYCCVECGRVIPWSWLSRAMAHVSVSAANTVIVSCAEGHHLTGRLHETQSDSNTSNTTGRSTGAAAGHHDDGERPTHPAGSDIENAAGDASGGAARIVDGQ